MLRHIALSVVLACLAARLALAARAEVSPKAVEYVLSKVDCSNPEDVCSAAFASACYDDPRSAYYYKNVGVRIRELGDGTRCHVFEPYEGSRSPRYFFALEDGRLRLLFKGHATFLLHRKPKVNGRYLVAFSDHSLSALGSGQLLTNWECISFWNGREYVVAYTVTESTLVPGSGTVGSRTRTRLAWNAAARKEFLDAPRTWTYVVDHQDTLTKIARRLETNLDEIIEQNGITRPDGIRVGQELHFDSRKAKSAQPVLPGGVSLPDCAEADGRTASVETSM